MKISNINFFISASLICLFCLSVAEHTQKNICYFIDYDGVIAEDKPIALQIVAVARKIPLSSFFLPRAIWQAKYAICDILWAYWYNKDILCTPHGFKLIGYKAYIDYFAVKAPIIKTFYQDIFDALVAANPMEVTIELIQKAQDEGAFIIIWTNNDHIMLEAKLNYLNQERIKLNKKAFIPDACFAIGFSSSENESPIGKPHVEFYQKGYIHACTVLKKAGKNPDETTFYFIDEKKESTWIREILYHGIGQYKANLACAK